jgi:hypothetical protein
MELRKHPTRCGHIVVRFNERHKYAELILKRRKPGAAEDEAGAK